VYIYGNIPKQSKNEGTSENYSPFYSKKAKSWSKRCNDKGQRNNSNNI